MRTIQGHVDDDLLLCDIHQDRVVLDAKICVLTSLLMCLFVRPPATAARWLTRQFTTAEPLLHSIVHNRIQDQLGRTGHFSVKVAGIIREGAIIRHMSGPARTIRVWHSKCRDQHVCCHSCVLRVRFPGPEVPKGGPTHGEHFEYERPKGFDVKFGIVFVHMHKARCGYAEFPLRWDGGIVVVLQINNKRAFILSPVSVEHDVRQYSVREGVVMILSPTSKVGPRAIVPSSRVCDSSTLRPLPAFILMTLLPSRFLAFL